MNDIKKTGSVFWARDCWIYLTFINHITNIRETRRYKTEAAAKAAETRFYNRMIRIYGGGEKGGTSK